MSTNTTFEFIRVEDHGETTCPHCGAMGRYIYVWKENGIERAAMAGCYAALTGKLNKDDKTKFMEALAVKVAKNKPLNGWEKRVIGLNDAIASGKASEDWANMKINEVLRDRKSYLGQKWSGR